MKAKEKDYVVRLNIELTKKQNGLFKRYVQQDRRTMTGWMRKQIHDAIDAQEQEEEGKDDA